MNRKVGLYICGIKEYQLDSWTFLDARCHNAIPNQTTSAVAGSCQSCKSRFLGMLLALFRQVSLVQFEKKVLSRDQQFHHKVLNK